MFQLGKLEFKEKSTLFRGSFCDAAMSRRMQYEGVPDLSWYIDIDMEKGDFICASTEEEEYCYESVMPKLYHNNGFCLDILSWKEIEGIVLNWDSIYNEKGEEAGSLYVFEHEDVTKGKIEFLKRNGTKFYIRWTGTANVFWNDEYGKDVPFAFEGEVNFDGITAYCDEISTLEELVPVMQQFVNLEEYECVAESSHKIQNGTSYQWKFMPKNLD